MRIPRKSLAAVERKATRVEIPHQSLATTERKATNNRATEDLSKIINLQEILGEILTIIQNQNSLRRANVW
jgi:hypothetical protein